MIKYTKFSRHHASASNLQLAKVWLNFAVDALVSKEWTAVQQARPRKSNSRVTHDPGGPVGFVDCLCPEPVKQSERACRSFSQQAKSDRGEGAAGSSGPAEFDWPPLYTKQPTYVYLLQQDPDEERYEKAPVIASEIYPAQYLAWNKPGPTALSRSYLPSVRN
ncbi:uncharacterized protein N7529_001176 [Penicillium soppii]|jgi:hypothetical protein|uniref:uncharacterized protein n=1 Tax=Penicillium soppii TaxID=69789 RepID=UPI002549B8E3|nr:uncharacterized protein N7529_001176 [Penicillium soppii]KAJ5882504.1 hypothetical protein N7529_001176 [Penicillium soppii]